MRDKIFKEIEQERQNQIRNWVVVDLDDCQGFSQFKEDITLWVNLLLEAEGKDLRKRAIQVAAMCVAMVESYDRLNAPEVSIEFMDNSNLGKKCGGMWTVNYKGELMVQGDEHGEIWHVSEQQKRDFLKEFSGGEDEDE